MQGGKASLADSGGSGFLVLKQGEAGLTGYWRAQKCPRVYTKLHALYQSQEVVIYCGYVYDETAHRISWRELEVVISSWARHDHPDCLELRACALQPSLN